MIEARSSASNGPMEHPYIDDQLIVERYALGKLAPEETVRFEHHYLHCQDCLEQVTLIDRLSRGFKRSLIRAADAAPWR